MPRKKHIARVQRSYGSLIAAVKTNDHSYNPRFPEHAGKASSDDLEHLRDLVHLKTELYELTSRFPISPNLQFTSSSLFIKNNAYVRADFMSTQCANIGPSALSLGTGSNRAVLAFEQKIFRIFHTVRALPFVAESLKMHCEFHKDLVAQTVKVLEHLDTIKELEWNRQRSEPSGAIDRYIFRNGDYTFTSKVINTI